MFDSSCQDEHHDRHIAGQAAALTNIELGVPRRLMLLGPVSALFLAACGKATPPSTGALPKQAEAPSGDFLRLSKVLTGHADLDAITAQRLLEAFALAVPAVHARIDALAALMHDGLSASDALAAATTQELRAAALAIVAAWYTGTAGQGTRAVTVSYREALMQFPTADALAPPTYALGGPAWWIAPPPDVGLPAHTPPASGLAPAQAGAR